MSELINNREFRKNTIKELLRMLHAGHSLEEVRARFAQAFSGVSASEISEAEQALMAEGVPLAEVQQLCDIHAAAFDGIIQPAPSIPSALAPGHPARILAEENSAIAALLDTTGSLLQRFASGTETASPPELLAALDDLRQVELHYMKKENLLFPYLEAHGITAPPKVMWGVDDEIRTSIKNALTAAHSQVDKAGTIQAVQMAMDKIREMIFKEDNILRPMLLETLTEKEWARVAEEGAELGFCLIAPPTALETGECRADRSRRACSRLRRHPSAHRCSFPYGADPPARHPAGGHHLRGQGRYGAILFPECRAYFSAYQGHHRAQGVELPSPGQRAS